MYMPSLHFIQESIKADSNSCCDHSANGSAWRGKVQNCYGGVGIGRLSRTISMRWVAILSEWVSTFRPLRPHKLLTYQKQLRLIGTTGSRRFACDLGCNFFHQPESFTGNLTAIFQWRALGRSSQVAIQQQPSCQLGATYLSFRLDNWRQPSRFSGNMLPSCQRGATYLRILIDNWRPNIAI